jgi:hypothetical protein
VHASVTGDGIVHTDFPVPRMDSVFFIIGLDHIGSNVDFVRVILASFPDAVNSPEAILVSQIIQLESVTVRIDFISFSYDVVTWVAINSVRFTVVPDFILVFIDDHLSVGVDVSIISWADPFFTKDWLEAVHSIDIFLGDFVGESDIIIVTVNQLVSDIASDGITDSGLPVPVVDSWERRHGSVFVHLVIIIFTDFQVADDWREARPSNNILSVDVKSDSNLAVSFTTDVVVFSTLDGVRVTHAPSNWAGW